MFENAIEDVSRFTRPMHTIIRNYNGLTSPASATFFFVNDRGVAITCKHVAQFILNADKINQNFSGFKQELNKLPRDGKFKTALKGLELKYHYTPETAVQMKHNFMNCFDSISEITCHIHPVLDLAILEFKGFNKIFYTSHAKFVKNSSKVRQGKYLCRLGFPFPEFSNFRHNPQTDDIEWTPDGNQNSPIFPIDGIVTRFVAEREVGITGIEMSTPGLRGQSGGPLFDTESRIYGMQFATRHLHLGFDMKDHEILMDGKKIKIANHPFLHVGVCVHVDRIKEFLHQHNIQFDEVE
ncbi:MAG TPA: hypothetical protein VK166_11060 [Chitinophagaceae bacterium]|nr:hypothetical protein [Chitinophagaceae bacterium]